MRQTCTVGVDEFCFKQDDLLAPKDKLMECYNNPKY